MNKHETKSNNDPRVCAFCGGPTTPLYPGGGFDEITKCRECEAEVTGVGPHTDPDRYHWATAAEQEYRRGLMRAAFDDAARSPFDTEWD